MESWEQRTLIPNLPLLSSAKQIFTPPCKLQSLRDERLQSVWKIHTAQIPHIPHEFLKTPVRGQHQTLR